MTDNPALLNEVYSASRGLVQRLADLQVSLAFTSYQSGCLYTVGHKPDGTLNVHRAGMPKPMGIVSNGEGALWLCCDFEIIRLQNVLNAGELANSVFDACFVARQSWLTGRLDAHDIGLLADGRVVFVNTRFNCLSTLDRRDSFAELWRPGFIDALIDEDRCHLNGLATQDGVCRYATAVSRSNTVDAWRDRRTSGGIVIDVATTGIVCEGLSMPHSPRLHRGELWLLNSGTGELGRVDGLETGDGQFEPVAFCPGFVRGLAFANDYAFVGLSKPRYERFEGLDLDRRLRDADSEPWCGVQVIDLRSGACVDWLRIDGDLAELYDIALIDNVRCAMTVGPHAPELARLVTLPRSS
ncbi:TIGR03032 family protein [Qingshengfaniella alkalisoli]|uniref:TIGR03032 family protein n=1 Tax=Qingshengfaniella alkalisoli TaxID=2599296 RepID=A0A5B8JBS3_9RHOB|nr:TIGR03032 family protein [Qingshengfaniella alkalisoli]QDY71550.1 TIGR03032 family protein [Qingshengfaniella alkalisoli]